MAAERFSSTQLERIETAFRVGAVDASAAMAKWLSVPSLITIESVEQRPIAEAVTTLSHSDDAVCFCVMSISGSLTGHLILGFDDASGLSLADLLLNHSAGASSAWGDVEESAALETHNIIGCAYLNSLARHIPAQDGALELVPSPPEFRRDYAESLLQSVFIDQAMFNDLVFVAKAKFEIRGEPLQWTLLFVPDAPSMKILQTALPDSPANIEDAE